MLLVVVGNIYEDSYKRVFSSELKKLPLISSNTTIYSYIIIPF